MGLAPGRPAKRVHCERCASGELWGQKAADIKGYSPQVETFLSECASNVVLATVPWHLLTYLYLSHLPKVSYMIMSRAFASALRVRIRSLAYTAFAWLCD